MYWKYFSVKIKGEAEKLQYKGETIARKGNPEYEKELNVSNDHVAPSIGKKLALTVSTSVGHSIGIVRSRTKATELLQLLTN
jgi:hypothetical protein